MSRITFRRKKGMKPSYEIRSAGETVGVLAQEQQRGCWYWYAMDGGPAFNSLMDGTAKPADLGAALSAAREWARKRLGGDEA